MQSQEERHNSSPADNAGRWANYGHGDRDLRAANGGMPPWARFRSLAWAGPCATTGGKQVLGKTSKMEQRDIRRLLITGAMVIVRRACRKAALERTWLHRMLRRRPRMLVAITKSAARLDELANPDHKLMDGRVAARKAESPLPNRSELSRSAGGSPQVRGRTKSGTADCDHASSIKARFLRGRRVLVQLAVNLAGGMATFLVETFEVRQSAE